MGFFLKKKCVICENKVTSFSGCKLDNGDYLCNK